MSYKIISIISATVMLAALLLTGVIVGQYGQYASSVELFRNARSAALDKCEATHDTQTCSTIVLIEISNVNLGNDVDGYFYIFQERHVPKSDERYEVLIGFNGAVTSVNIADIKPLK